MGKTTKVLLLLAIVCLVAGFLLNSGLIGVGECAALYVIFPFGAIFAGLFLISKLLEKESARYDEEHRAADQPPQPKPNLGNVQH